MAQYSESFEKAQKFEAKYAMFGDFADPSFPVTTGNDEKSLQKYYIELEKYAKEHPPLKQQDFFPRFIPYSRYDQRLSESFDLQLYEDQVNQWLEKNPEKAELIDNK
jgi:hypothetical protein